MKTAKKFTSFDDLKSSVEGNVLQKERIRKHSEFERFLRSVCAVKENAISHTHPKEQVWKKS